MNDSPGRNSPGPFPPGPPGPPPGWQNGPGWGHQQWGPPPNAPKPGVVPLRPLGLGEILQGSFSTLFRYWRTVLPVSFGIALVTQAVTTVANGLWLKGGETLELGDEVSAREAMDAMTDSLGATGVSMVAGLVGSILASSILTVVVSRAVLGRSVSAAEAWRDARPQLARMAGLLCLIPLMLLGVFAVVTAPGLLLFAAGAEPAGVALALLGSLAGLAAMMWLWIRYSLAPPALMLEKQGVIESLRRSAKLVRGAWWRILGVQIVALLIIFAMTMIVQIPFGAIQLTIGDGDLESATSLSWPSLIITGVGAVISSTIALPFMAGVTALIYLDQRIRRESLDVELIRAANSG
ncbi:glycerophosphoryl diester phosphodiesterase membrane domain-containing protein [Streptomyces huiliensis]|uniref:glycerophosphoryl diester phosphodiesterase membrane domain-containing protein n=1 Tax=Streptomyces huiliensis TaxID=2876027 RepID=UPI001CBB04A1|nr:glycerophosphoryl diester phosphodiesterase membrane domain-containing protein [Streptomyces huiliensis]MBZ4324223.1 glycerophosphoryl diester phosphodiesterase membrane domain-containing protein [Streptomyces huiliensis]